MKLLVLDNYDSFTYNLVHLIDELGFEMDVFRNDKISLEEVDKYDKILLSPGPGIPSEAGIMPELIKKYAATKSIFGVCLGHQAISEAFGAELFNLPLVLHGIVKDTKVLNKVGVFEGITDTVATCRYHSWVVKNDGLPNELEVTAVDEEGLIMGIRHKKFDVQGVQFHPESFLTDQGRTMLSNWLKK